MSKINLDDSPALSAAVASWFAARKIIADAFSERNPCSQYDAERFASACIARLAHHEPPIFVAFADELKD